MSTSQDDRSLGELFSALATDTSTLVRQEVELAKTEMTQKATRVGKDIGFLLAGGAVAYAGFLGNSGYRGGWRRCWSASRSPLSVASW
jgi:hypothetical protein